MQRVLVAGATGYLGGFVVKELASRGHFVRALARSPEKLVGLAGAVDEIARGEVTQPDTLRNVCDGIDVVFSSIGITRQKDGLTFKDVDYQGNKNLLDVALRAGVRKFIYVSIMDGPALKHLDIVKAHEDFVAELEASGIEYTIMRPTGYFSDMEEVLDMARKGRVYLFGAGETHTNPIHGADLAVRCVDALDSEKREIPVGGPDTLTWREVAELAFMAVGKPPRITRVPAWVIALLVFLTRLFSRHSAGLLAFFSTMATRDLVGPPFGSRHLADHYRGLASREPEVVDNASSSPTHG